MKITLIEPKSPDSHIFSLFALPRLGTLLLGTILKDRGHDISVAVETIKPVSWDDAITSDLVGISTTTSTAPRAYEMADYFRNLGITTVMGGPHVTFLPDEALAHTDYVIRGEGESSFPHMVETLLNKGDMGDVPGLSSMRDGKIIHNAMDPSFVDLNELPHPDITLIGEKNVKKNMWTKRVIPIQTSRGCPYHCTFCSVTQMFGKRMRYRDVDVVIGDLREYDKRNNSIFFYDDNFVADPQRTKQLLEKMINERFSFVSSAQVRVEAGKDRELLKLMRRVGLKTVFVGLESISPESLTCMNKKHTLADMEEGLEGFSRFGIKVHGMFVLGFDSDDRKSLNETIRFAKKKMLNSVQFLVLTPFPGTPVYNELKEEGRIIVADWSFYDGHHVVFNPVRLSPYHLQRTQIRGHRRFYSTIEVVKRFIRFDFFGVMVAAYAKRLIKTWIKKNNFYVNVMKLIQSTERYIINIDLRRKTSGTLFLK